MLIATSLVTKALVIGLLAVLALAGLLLYARFSKSERPLGQGGCHGDCAHCASHCEDEKRPE